MAIDPQHHRTLRIFVAATFLVASVAAAIPGRAQTSETPRRGGVLLAAIGADAPSLDPHQESTFATLQPVAPLYSTYHMPGFWWTRNVVHWAKVRNYIAQPSQFTNQKLQDVWLAED